MATLEDIRVSPKRPTMLSQLNLRRELQPRFHATSGRWSSEQTKKPCIGFDLTWDTPPDNEWQSYGVLVHLTGVYSAGNLVLLVHPRSNELVLATVGEGSFEDACTHERIEQSHNPRVLGRVIDEHNGLSGEQIDAENREWYEGWNKGAVRRSDWLERLEVGLERLEEEEKQIDLKASLCCFEFDLWDLAHMLTEHSVVKELATELRGLNDTEDGEEFDQSKFASALGKAMARMVRVGQYVGPDQRMLDPHPDDVAAVDRMITESLARVEAETVYVVDQDSLELSDAPPLTAFEVALSLITLPAYHEARDEFRNSDSDDEHWSPDHPKADDLGRFDYPLRSMLADWFRAGMFAARTYQKPNTPQPHEAPTAAEQIASEVENG